jgi:hypothetical protein
MVNNDGRTTNASTPNPAVAVIAAINNAAAAIFSLICIAK